MAKNIEPRLKFISDYLKIGINERFLIPEYQRGYSWDVTQCDDLFQSVESFIQEKQAGNNDPYFFGTIIVDCSDSNRLSLIDGQQRTTSFLLLLKALMLRIEDKLNNVPAIGGINTALVDGLNEIKNRIFDILYKTDVLARGKILNNWDLVTKISLLENVSINELYPEELQKILSARTYADAEYTCYKIPRKKYDNKYTPFFRNFKFFYDKLEPKSYGESRLYTFANTLLMDCQIIEIRSWQVEQAIEMFNSLNSKGLPLSDADIISAKLYSNSRTDEERTNFKTTWKAMNDIVNNLETKKIINIDSVLQEYMYIRRAEDKEYINTGTESIDVTMPGLRKYYTRNNDAMLKQPEELNDKLFKLVKVWDKIQDYPVVKLLLKFNENIKIYFIAYLNRYEIDEISQDIVTEIAESLIRLFTILELVDTGYSSKNFKTFLFGEMLKIVDKNTHYSDIKADFDSHINKTWKRETLIEPLEDYDKNVLVFLNEYLYAKKKHLPFDFDEKVNIEHIMPASGKNIISIRNDAKITSVEEFNGIVNKLGNKILLEEEINKSISNDWFKTKKQTTVEDKSGYKNSDYNIATALVNYPSDTWTKSDIDNATTKAIDRILDFVFDCHDEEQQ